MSGEDAKRKAENGVGSIAYDFSRNGRAPLRGFGASRAAPAGDILLLSAARAGSVRSTPQGTVHLTTSFESSPVSSLACAHFITPSRRKGQAVRESVGW